MSWLEGYDLFRSSGRESVFISQSQEAAHIPCLVALCHSELCFSCHISISDSGSLAFLSEGPCDYTEPDQMIRDNLPISRALITSAKSLLSCEVTSSQVPRIETWTSLGAIVSHIPGSNNILESVILDPQIAPCFWVVLAPYFCWNCGNEMVLQSF